MTNELPKSLSIDLLSDKQLPGDITVGEACAWLARPGGPLDAIRGVVKYPDRVRVRFLYADSGDELPADMPMREARRLAAAGKSCLAVDDGYGGMPVKEDA